MEEYVEKSGKRTKSDYVIRETKRKHTSGVRMVALNKSVYRASSGNWTTSKQWQWTHVHVHSVRVVRQFERRCLSRGPRGVGTRFHNMATKAVVHPDETRSQPLCNMAETICRSRLVCPGLSTRDWLRQRGWRRLTLEKKEKKKKGE